jgi:chromodomain-containing protein
MKIHPVVHISLLDKTENQETEIEYDVEKIIDKRVRNGVIEYKIRWLGFDESEDTWEPTKHLSCPEKVREFEDLRNRTRED